MPQLDKYHYVVRNALIKDGWVIVNDPMRLVLDETYLYVDLEAVNLDPTFMAQYGTSQVAIEVKVLRSLRVTDQLEKAIGQYIIYRSLLQLRNPTHQCYLAVSDEDYQSYMRGSDFQYVLSSNQIHLLIFDHEQEEIVQWIHQTPTKR
jgi:hypothetical protein